MKPDRNTAERFILQLVRSMLTQPSRMIHFANGSTLRVTVSRPDQGRIVGRGGSNIYAIRSMGEALSPPVNVELTEPEEIPSVASREPWTAVEAVENAIQIVPSFANTKVKVDPENDEQDRMTWKAKNATCIKAVRAMERIALAIAIVRGNKTFVEVET